MDNLEQNLIKQEIQLKLQPCEMIKLSRSFATKAEKKQPLLYNKQ